MQKLCLALILSSGFLSLSANGQYTIHTFAGGGPLDGTRAMDIALGASPAVAISASGELYIAAAALHRVFKVSANGTIITVAGNGVPSHSGDGGPGAQASVQYPTAIELDAAGNLYIAQPSHHRIRKVRPDGTIVTVAGNGLGGFSGDGGSALTASLAGPRGIAVDAAGNLYIADTINQRIRRVSSAGVITTVAGNGSAQVSGMGGPATSVSFTSPEDVAIDTAGNLYIAATPDHRILKVTTTGIISTYAGTGAAGFSGDNGPATAATMWNPSGVTTDADGNLYIADSSNRRIRKVSPTGVMTTIAGNGALSSSGDGGPPLSAAIGFPRGVALDTAGNLYIADANNALIRKVSVSGLISTAAGNGQQAFSGDGGPAKGAQLNLPFGLVRDAAGNFYVADSANNRVRKISPAGVITTVAGDGRDAFGLDGIPAIQSSLKYPQGLAIDGNGILHIADGSGRVRKILPDGTIRAVAGGFTQSLGDGGPALAASLSSPGDMVFDPAGNLYVIDPGHSRVRKIDAQGIISTVAGNGVHGYSGDGGPATNAALWTPSGIALDRAGNLYIADYTNGRIRKVSPDGIITTAAGNGVFGDSGDGGPALSASLRPATVAVDSDGSLIICDGGNYRIRRISTSGIITTIAGNGVQAYAGDGGPAEHASFSSPYIMALHPNGSIYIADGYSYSIRVLVPNLSVQPAALSFNYQVGTVPPFPQTVLVAGDALLTTATASTTSGVPWLSVTPLSATTPAGYSVSISPSGLTPGVQTGTIRISSTDGRLVTIPVTLIVTSFCTWSVSPSSLSFPATATPATLTVTVNSGCPWTASSGTPWISITSGTSGSATGTVTLNVEANSGPMRAGPVSIAGQIIIVTQAPSMTSGLRFVPLIPCRIIDTRPNTILSADETRAINLPTSNCNVPLGAAAYSLNVTAVPTGPLGYLSMWATGQPKPLVSTLNSQDGRIKSNAAIVPAGTGGAVNVFVTDPTHVVLDINGYFTRDIGYSFYPTPSCRITDTRFSATLAPFQVRTINIPAGQCGIPSTAAAYSFNITAVPVAGTLGYLATWPTGQPQPLVSTLNAPNGTITANAAIVPAGTNSSINFLATNPTELIIDSNGYFAVSGQPNERIFHPVTPCRVIDTRFTAIMAAGETRTIHVPSSPCNIPATAKAYSLNATVVPTGLLAYITLWPSDMAQPFVSTLNDYDGIIVSNAAIVPAAANGSINAFVTNTTHLILDINGYFQ